MPRHSDVAVDAGPAGAERRRLRVHRPGARRRAAPRAVQVREALRVLPGLNDSLLVRRRAGPADRALLFERHPVSKELAGLEPQHPFRSGAGVSGDGLSVMINEEDHLASVASIGVRAPRRVRSPRPVDRELADGSPSRTTPSSGIYGVPDERGNGMRASVLIHLPGLVLTKEIGGCWQGSADGAHVPRAVRRGIGSGGQLLPDLEPDDARTVGGGPARSTDPRWVT